jgi:DNA-binding HxlR family transcriptional regulator
MHGHADYCPIAIGAEVLGDRWTPLVIRELMVGAHGFNEIHRGIPKVSRTLLAQRLRQLERLGLVQRDVAASGKAGCYQLTEAGEAITPIGLSVIWRLHQHAIPSKLPLERTVVHLVLTGTNGAEGWLEISRSGVTVCKDDQGHDVDLAVEADTAQMHRWLVGLVPFRELVADGRARLLGPSRLARGFPTWFDVSYFAEGLRRAELRRSDHAVAQ